MVPVRRHFGLEPIPTRNSWVHVRVVLFRYVALRIRAWPNLVLVWLKAFKRTGLFATWASRRTLDSPRTATSAVENILTCRFALALHCCGTAGAAHHLPLLVPPHGGYQP